MTDPYLLLTPVLALAVLALARFVGCDRVFRLDPVAPVPDKLPFVESYALGQPRMNPTDPFAGWVGMVIRVGATPLTVTELGRIMRSASTEDHLMKLVERAGTTGGSDIATVTIPPSAAIPPSADNLGFAYATLQPAVVLKADTDYFVVSYETAMGADAWHDVDTTVTTTEVAAVTAGVFSGDSDPTNPNPVNVYQQMGGPGATYGPVDFRYQKPE